MFSQSVLLMLSISVCVVTNANEFVSVEKQKHILATKQAKGAIKYWQGLMTGSALDQPVKKMLAALSRSANLRIEQRYQPGDDETVSYQLRGVQLRVALKDLLEGYSYLFIPAGEEKTPGKLILLGRKDGGNRAQNQLQSDILASEVRPEVKGKVSEAQVSTEEPKKITTGPRNLDDFISLEKLTPKLAYGPESEEQRREREEQEARYAEALLQRALAALESDYDNLYGQALAALQGMNAPEAIAALLEAAQGGYSKSTDLQFFAAETLAHHAADLGYKNQLANDSLKQLGESKVPAVRELVEKALNDMRYAQKKWDGTNG